MSISLRTKIVVFVIGSIVQAVLFGFALLGQSETASTIIICELGVAIGITILTAMDGNGDLTILGGTFLSVAAGLLFFLVMCAVFHIDIPLHPLFLDCKPPLLPWDNGCS